MIGKKTRKVYGNRIRFSFCLCFFLGRSIILWITVEFHIKYGEHLFMHVAKNMRLNCFFFIFCGVLKVGATQIMLSFCYAALCLVSGINTVKRLHKKVLIISWVKHFKQVTKLIDFFAWTYWFYKPINLSSPNLRLSSGSFWLLETSLFSLYASQKVTGCICWSDKLKIWEQVCSQN